MAWIIVVLTPLLMVQIVLSFFYTSDKDRDLPSIARSYLTGFFIFDVLATLPPMITG